MKETDAAYIAGLFDGEGHVIYKQYPKKRKGQIKAYPTWKITLEISMTEESIVRWVHEVLGVGTLNKKPRKGRRKDGTKYLMQYRWRCTFRDAYYVCCLIWPFAHTKLPKIQQVINHYSKQSPGKTADIVNIDEYRMRKEMMFE